MPVPTDLLHFTPGEFHHPELVDESAARFLDAVRTYYGQPLVITSDARTPEENAAASGSSPTSWHLKGRAFDLRMPPFARDLWNLVGAIYRVYGEWKPLHGETSIELELVQGPTDKHIHLALANDGSPNKLELSLD